MADALTNHPVSLWNTGRRITRKGDIDAEIIFHVHGPVLYLDGEGHSDLERGNIYPSAESIIASVKGGN